MCLSPDKSSVIDFVPQVILCGLQMAPVFIESMEKSSIRYAGENKKSCLPSLCTSNKATSSANDVKRETQRKWPSFILSFRPDTSSFNYLATKVEQKLPTNTVWKSASLSIMEKKSWT